ncbi:MAG TPA: protein kinase [Pyrinomonadaceae bacterium]|nr:protein kinase [Pyrinomonadaceae bacterium]
MMPVSEKMTPERWRRVETIFQTALDVAPENRERFLAEACAGDEVLHREVERLIEGYEAADEFLEQPAVDLKQIAANELPTLRLEDLHGSAHALESGAAVGAYRVIGELGRGGMGAVYLAERADGDFRKLVAVKVVKRGMDTEFVLRRFRHERRALAALDHPNIARLLDAGATHDGLPYIIMEYVEGQDIDRYCDERKLSINARLRLFLAVCAGVSHAHRNLIIHRDIKPSNILVTADGTPKLLDFGIAKILNPTLADAPLEHTATALRMLTPDYASPEQVRGERVTTASDVYSLGVLLYLLLTGRPPYYFRTHQFGEIARVVCEQNPLRPSAAINSAVPVAANDFETVAATGEASADRRAANAASGDGQTAGVEARGAAGNETRGAADEARGATGDMPTLDELARARSSAPDRLRRSLADDLDNIVLKALRKEPVRRYASVEQFAEDIERHLEGLPVRARADTFTYRSRKFVGRNKAGVAAAIGVALSLVGGLTATTWQWRAAQVQRARAEAESGRAKRRFEDLRRLTHSMMFEMHDAVSNLEGSTTARRLLAQRTLEYLDGLAREASDDPTLQIELFIAYINLGDVQGNPFYPNIGDTAGALESYRKAQAIADALDRAAPTDERARRRVWLTHIKIGDMQAFTGDTNGAKESFSRAQAIIEDLAAAHPENATLQQDLGSSYDRSGNVLLATGDARAALDSFRRALAIFRELSAKQPANDALRRNVASTYGQIGKAQLGIGALDESLASYRKLVELNRARFAGDPANAVTRDDLAGSLGALGVAQAEAGDMKGARQSVSEQLEMYREMSVADPANVKTRTALADAGERLKKLAR